MTVICEVRYAHSIRDSSHDDFLALTVLSETPQAGETINIDGHPYYVLSKGWAAHAAEDNRAQFFSAVEAGKRTNEASICFIRVLNLVHTDPPWLRDRAKRSEWHQKYRRPLLDPDDVDESE